VAQMRFGAPLTPMVRRILIANVAIWLVMLLGTRWFAVETLIELFDWTLLHPAAPASDAHAFLGGALWQPFTYMWLHDVTSVFHVLFNMIMLWLFGGLFETRWGGVAFLKFYILCGVGGAAGSLLGAAIAPELMSGAVLGASGAILGLIAAFGLIFPKQKIHLWFILPIEGRHIIWITIVLDTLMFLTEPRGFAFAAHMGGLLMGYLLVTGNWRPSLLKDRLQLRQIRQKKRHLRVVPDNENKWMN
jgi:membrane associated rhomboid family serine protease